MRYRLSLLSTQSAQPLLRFESQLLVSRKDTWSVSHYAWTWREILPCLLIWSHHFLFATKKTIGSD